MRQERDLDELIQAEILCIDAIRVTNPFAKLKYARYLEIEDMDKEDQLIQERTKDLVWFTSKEEWRWVNKDRKCERKEERKAKNKAILAYLTKQQNMNEPGNGEHSLEEPTYRPEKR